MQLGQLKKSIRSAKEAAILDKAITNIKEMVNKSRSLTFELSPPILYEFGLEKTLEWLADQVYKQYNLFVAIEDDRQKKPLNADMKIFLYQAVRELLNNVTKHSRKEKAIVSIKKDNSHITVCVEDNGVGFDISGLDSFDTMKGKFGLFHIKERMEQLGGQFVITSQPNRGTHVTLIAPLQNTA
jgi:signal transduction histidine kinase